LELSPPPPVSVGALNSACQPTIPPSPFTINFFHIFLDITRQSQFHAFHVKILQKKNILNVVLVI
jgi:hypothetical protein